MEKKEQIYLCIAENCDEPVVTPSQFMAHFKQYKHDMSTFIGAVDYKEKFNEQLS